MAGFTYFFPGRQGAGVSPNFLAENQLGYLRTGATRKTTRGPGGEGGLLVAGPGDQTVEFTENQIWRPIPQSTAWVGFDPQAAPTPEALAKREQLQGHEAVLGDGQRWLIPVARGWMEQESELRWYVALPQKSSLNTDGEWTRGEVVRRYRELWGHTERWWGVLSSVNGSATLVEFDHEEQACVCALQTNYYLGPTEVDLLELLDDETRGRILNALVDMPNYLQIVKKKKASQQKSTEGTRDTSLTYGGVTV